MSTVIAIVGYTVTAIFAVSPVACLCAISRPFGEREEAERSEVLRSLFLGTVLTLGSAMLTWWLTGGAFR